MLTYGDPTRVIPARKDDLKANPDDLANWRALAVAYLKSAQFSASRVNAADDTNSYIKQARDLLADAVKKFPADRTMVGMYADACAALDDFAPAEAALKAFAARDEWKDKPDPKVMQAELYARMGRWDDAEKAYTAALGLSDNAPEIRLRASAYLAGRGKIDPALAMLPADDADARIRRQRINVLSSAGRFPEAEQAIRASLVKTPDSLEMQALLASVYLDQGQFENATAQLETVLAKDPNNRMAQYVRGLVKMRKSPPDLDGAIADLLAASDATPGNVDVRIALADAYTARNSIDQASRVLSAGVKLAPTNKQLRLKLLSLNVRNQRWGDVDSLLRDASLLAPLQQDPEWLAAEGNAWGARGSYDKAADRMKAAMTLAPDNLNLTQAYINLLIQGRNYKAAIVAADKVVQANDAWWAHQAKAIAKKSMNDRSGAEADLAAALKSAQAAKNADAVASVINTWATQIGVDEALAQLKPLLDQGVRWRLQATSLYLKKQDYTAAKASMESTMADMEKASPAEHLDVLRFAGSFYLNVFPSEPAKARDAYLKVLNRTPNDIAALNNMACLLAEGVTPREPVQALKYSGIAYDSLNRTGQFNARIFDTQGWMLILNDRVNDGIDILRQVVARDPFTDAHYHLAMGYLKLKDPQPDEAQRQLALARTAYDLAAKTEQADPAMKAKIEAASTRAAELIKSTDPNAPSAKAN
jgi:tetratricopeptide (TPR) repeat protein